jgi:signal transduction histidine kinase
MKTHRLTSPSLDPHLRWFLEAATARYGTAIVVALLGLGLRLIAARWLGVDGTMLVLLGAKLIRAQMSSRDAVALPHLQLLLAEGIVMSFLGFGLMALRRRTRDAEKANQDLERRVLEIGEAERQRIGHDLHDGLGQVLTGISLLSESMAQHIQNGRMPEVAQAETITRLVSEAIGNTRDLARNLAPLTLERDGLLAAMEELSENAPQLLGISCKWQHTGTEPKVDHNRALHLYRITQEAVNNSVKHGHAQNVIVSLDVADHSLRLQVIDDGSGLSPKTVANPGLGLRIMRYRARMIDALLTVERAGPAGGTIVNCVCRESESTPP